MVAHNNSESTPSQTQYSLSHYILTQTELTKFESPLVRIRAGPCTLNQNSPMNDDGFFQSGVISNTCDLLFDFENQTVDASQWFQKYLGGFFGKNTDIKTCGCFVVELLKSLLNGDRYLIEVKPNPAKVLVLYSLTDVSNPICN